MKKMLVRKQHNYYIIDAPSFKLDLSKAIDLSNMKLWVDKKAEWKEIFDESWRQTS